MSNFCKKLSSNFSLTWDPEDMTKNFPVFSSNDDKPYSLPNGTPHWQLFSKTNILFARNFYFNFKTECKEIVEKLEILKIELSKKNNNDIIIQNFLSSRLIPNNISIIKTIPGKNIELHKDITRKFCINIGLKNSNKWTTFISNNNNIDEFYNSSKTIFTMEDGDVYYLYINNPHYADCLNKYDVQSTRYILTCTII